MISKILFFLSNSIAPGSGFLIASRRAKAIPYLLAFLVLGVLVFYFPLLPINVAFFVAILLWPINLVVSLILTFLIGPNKEHPLGLGRKLLSILACLFISWGAYILGFQTGRIRLIRTISHSMVPTFEHGEIVLVERNLFSIHAPERGDVVIYDHPLQENLQLIKRVVGLAHDEISSKGLLVRSDHYKESLVKAMDNKVILVSNGTHPYTLNFEREVVPEEEINKVKVQRGQFFGLGDNRQRSVDSRSYGPVSLENILGIAKYVVFSERKNIFLGLQISR